MKNLIPKFKEADVIVWASPVYYAGITGPLKNLMDRMLPLHLQGELGPKRQKIVLVSTCSAWELSMFDPILAQMKAIYTKPDGSSDFAGALLRPMADGMKEIIMSQQRGLVEGVFQAAREAGYSLFREGKISEKIQTEVSKELMPKDAYYKAAEEWFEKHKSQ
jgi:multimeric flavodoxin WrbA